MDAVIAKFLSWLVTQGPFVILATLVMYFNKTGQWMWKREVEDKVTAEASKTLAQAVLTGVWKDRAEEWKLSSNKWESMALQGTSLAKDLAKTIKDTGAAA